jgi:hypothetical protein
VFQLCFNLNKIHDSVGKALRTANQGQGLTTLMYSHPHFNGDFHIPTKFRLFHYERDSVYCYLGGGPLPSDVLVKQCTDEARKRAKRVQKLVDTALKDT